MLRLMAEQPEWLPLEEALQEGVAEPQRSQILTMIEAERPLLQMTRGSTNNHQAWEGGWWDHYADGMNLIRVLYPTLSLLRPLKFTQHDAMVSYFAHDIEKPWKYDLGADGQWHHKSNFETKEDANQFRLAKLAAYGIVLTDVQLNGMEFAEGEIAGTYSNRERRSSELAAFVHMIDHCSARVFWGAPFEKNDPWQGAYRIRDHIKAVLAKVG